MVGFPAAIPCRTGYMRPDYHMNTGSGHESAEMLAGFHTEHRSFKSTVSAAG